MEEINYHRGCEAIEHRNYRDAITYFTNSIKIKRSNGAFANRAYAYKKLGKFDLAKTDFQSCVKIATEIFNNAKGKDRIYIDRCIKDIIIPKSMIADIEMKSKNFTSAESIFSELIDLYRMLLNKNILNEDLHISNFLSNRGMANLFLDRIEDAANDLGAAYVQCNSEKLKHAILVCGEIKGISVKINNAIKKYSTLSNL